MTEAAQGAMFPKRQSYFFMLIVDEIVLREQSFVPSPCDVRFLLYKGPQIFNQTEKPASLNFGLPDKGCIKVENVELSFFLKEFNPNRKNDFTLKVREVLPSGEYRQMGAFDIHANEFVREYTQKGFSVVSKSLQFGSFTLNYHILTEQTKQNLEQALRQFKQEQQLRLALEQHSEIKGSPEGNKDSQSDSSAPSERIAITIRKMSKNVENCGKEVRIYENPLITSMGNKPYKRTDSGYSLLLEQRREWNWGKIRLLLFLVVSVCVIYFIMSPSRKTPHRKN